MKKDVLIIGGGLSGLHTLYALHKKGASCALVEGRKRLGGRILSVNLDQQDYDATKPGFDLGPAWFWPGQQRMLTLVQELGLAHDMFAESPNGAAVYEDPNGHVQRGMGSGAMAGSYRLRGGIRQIIHELAQSLPQNLIHTGSRVISLILQDDEITTRVKGDGVEEWHSRFVVVAVPPRVTMASIQFAPTLDAARIEKLNSVATWMAGQAKVVALYDTPFWREQGLSGDAMSRHGPMQEIHDASVSAGGPYALFGFVGVPVAHRQGHETELKAAAVEQLTRLFGSDAANPREVYLKDWAFDTFTATERDQQPLRSQPSNDPGELAESTWNKRLLWSGTETAPTRGNNNGYLEGALESSEATLKILENAFA